LTLPTRSAKIGAVRHEAPSKNMTGVLTPKKKINNFNKVYWLQAMSVMACVVLLAIAMGIPDQTPEAKKVMMYP